MPRVELGQSPRQAGEHLIHKRADQAQRMIRRNTPFDVNVTEELDRPLVNSAHRAPLDTCESIADNAPRESHPNRLENTLFQQPAKEPREHFACPFGWFLAPFP